MAKRPPPTTPTKSRLDPAALSIDELATLLTRAGGRPIGADQVRRDLAAGAPQNPDGTLHLVHYAAWLALQTA
jgi:hypothetical protein